MSMGDYLRDNLGRILLHLGAMLALSAFLLLTGTAVGVVGLVLLVWGLGLCLLLIVGGLRQKRRLAGMWAILEGLDREYLFMECAPKPRGAYERQLFEILRRAGRAMTGEVGTARQQQRDYREYIEGWVHEVKVPLTTMRLVCENNPAPAMRKIQAGLAEVERQVERALFYARSSRPGQDLVVRRTRLAAVADTALSRHRDLLIGSGVRVETASLDLDVYTDGKWLEFILGQLLVNAVQYRGAQPLITLSAQTAEAGVRLTIADNGLGIPDAELPRIFDKGFTGSNGRSRADATGMGLFICRKLAAHLQVGLVAESAEGEYTRIHLLFPPAGGDG